MGVIHIKDEVRSSPEFPHGICGDYVGMYSKDTWVLDKPPDRAAVSCKGCIRLRTPQAHVEAYRRHLKHPSYIRVDCDSYTWSAPPKGNGVWEIPDGVDEIRGKMETVGPWSLIRKYRALAISPNPGNFMGGVIWGVRSLDKAREDGYNLEGHVRVNGHTYRGFTGSKMFQRPDGSLVDVAVIHVCDGPRTPDPKPRGGYCYASSKRYPKEPKTVVFSDELRPMYRYVGEWSDKGTAMNTWRYRGPRSIRVSGERAPLYVFQTK